MSLIKLPEHLQETNRVVAPPVIEGIVSSEQVDLAMRGVIRVRHAMLQYIADGRPLTDVAFRDFTHELVALGTIAGVDMSREIANLRYIADHANWTGKTAPAGSPTTNFGEVDAAPPGMEGFADGND